MSEILSKEDILNITDVQVKEIEVPEWDGTIFLRGMTGDERDALEASMFSSKSNSRETNLKNLRARLLVKAICDEKGNRLFTDADAEKLGKKNAKVLDRLFNIARELSGLGESDVEEITKNSETAPQGGSISD